MKTYILSGFRKPTISQLRFLCYFMAKYHNFSTLKDVMQGANQQACLLYEKCGFLIDSRINIYHYWNKKNAYSI